MTKLPSHERVRILVFYAKTKNIVNRVPEKSEQQKDQTMKSQEYWNSGRKVTVQLRWKYNSLSSLKELQALFSIKFNKNIYEQSLRRYYISIFLCSYDHYSYRILVIHYDELSIPYDSLCITL